MPCLERTIPLGRLAQVMAGCAVLVTAGTAAAIYGLINVGSHGWAATSTAVPLLLAAAVWAVFVVIERRARRPLLAVGLLGQRSVLAGSFLMLVVTGLMVGGFFLGSFALQRAHHYSALHVGLAFLPVAVATVAGAQGGTQVLTRFNTRIGAVTGLALAAAGAMLRHETSTLADRGHFPPAWRRCDQCLPGLIGW